MQLTEMTKTHNKIHITAISERLYLSIVVLYIIRAFLDTTVFCLSWFYGYEIILRIFACIVILLKLYSTGKWARKEWLLCIIACVLFKLSWSSVTYSFLLDIALLMAGAMGIFYKKILKAGFWAGTYALLLTILGSLAGCIIDLVYAEGTQFRHSFGIVYPTDFAAHVTFIVIAGWVIYGGSYALLSVGSVLVLAIFIFYYCHAKCSTIVLCLLAVVMLFYALRKKNKKIRRATGWIDELLIYTMPLCAFVMIGLTLIYNEENEVLRPLNAVLNNRLKLGLTAIRAYGIKTFGTAFEQIGFGGGTAWSWNLNYSFVDSSYVLILVRYGLLILLILCLLYILLGKKALQNGHGKIVLATTIIAIHSMIEHHFLEVSYNLFLLLPFADFTMQSSRKEQKKCNLSSKNLVIKCTVILLSGITIITTLFISTNYLKTIVDILHLNYCANHIHFVWLASLALMVLYLSLWTTKRAITTLFHKTPLPKHIMITSFILLFVLGSFFLLGESIIQQGKKEYESFLKKEQPIIEELLEAKSTAGKLYIGHMPELYKRDFNGITGTVFFEEALAGYENVTLITEDVRELQALLIAGYVYGQISQKHAVYTNSTPAKEILGAAEITLTDFYSRQNTVDLAEAARRNNLELTEKGTILLRGNNNALVSGPGVDVYKGWLQVAYKLQLIDNSMKDDATITAKVTSEWGKRTLGQADIILSDFDEQGQYICIIDINIWMNCPNIEFQLFTPSDVEVELLEIMYGKTGKAK